MQDDRRSMSAPTAGPHGTQLKIAIPRLTSRRAPPPATAKSRQRDRVQRACRNCHKRKIKCSGTLPRCNYCEKTNKPCVYERPRKDRLALANDRNQTLVSVLKELSLRVSDSDRQRIADALHDSDDEPVSPAFTSSSRTSAGHQNQKHAHLHPLVSSAGHLSQAVGTSPVSDQSSMPRLDGIFPDDSFDDEASDSWDVVEAGYLGQVSEVQWLQNLQSRMQTVNNAFLKPTMVSAPIAYPVSANLAQSLAFMAMDQNQSVPPTTYHLDDEGVKFLVGDNPFELPPEQTADLLFQCFNRTVQNSFPMIPVKLETQLRQYYNLIRTRQDVHCPETWFALVNLVFAIGAKFSHLIQADWRADAFDHITYISRAYQLLNMNDAVFMLSTPNLSSTQAAGLFAIYYMSAGHYNRAWVIAGGAMRSAFSLGLHVQQEDHSISAARQQNKVDTWWSLHSLDSLLSSITGRSGTFPSEEITTPSSKAFSDILSNTRGQGTSATKNMIFLNADSNLHLLTQQVMSSLYTQRKLTPTWSQVQQIMVALVGDLDKWVIDCVPQFHSDIWSMNYEQQRENSLLKLHYYRVKILTTRPSLRRIERCAESGSIEFTDLDQSMAEACIQAASDVVSVLGTASNINVLYEKGPWWTIVHNVMQALAVLMNAIACPDHFPSSLSLSTYGVRQLVGWLRLMRVNNVLAARAYQVVYSIVKTSKPYVWAGVADAFLDDSTVILQPPALVPALVDAKYVPWPANEQPVDSWFDYDLDTFFGFHYPLI